MKHRKNCECCSASNLIEDNTRYHEFRFSIVSSDRSSIREVSLLYIQQHQPLFQILSFFATSEIESEICYGCSLMEVNICWQEGMKVGLGLFWPGHVFHYSGQMSRRIK